MRGGGSLADTHPVSFAPTDLSDSSDSSDMIAHQTGWHLEEVRFSKSVVEEGIAPTKTSGIRRISLFRLDPARASHSNPALP